MIGAKETGRFLIHIGLILRNKPLRVNHLQPAIQKAQLDKELRLLLSLGEKERVFLFLGVLRTPKTRTPCLLTPG